VFGTEKSLSGARSFLVQFVFELHRTALGHVVNRYGLCFELNRAGVWRAVYR